MNSPRLLIYEPLCGGHRPDFIGCLVDYLHEHPTGGRIRFALPADFFQNDPRRASLLKDLAPAVEWTKTPPHAESPEALLQTIEAFQPDGVLFLELTRWEGFLCRHKLPCDLAGILFVQYPEIDWRAGSGLDRWIRLARRIAKQRKTSLWLRSQSVRAVFLLNGERAADWLNTRFPDRPVFRAIPDPAPAGEGTTGVDDPGCSANGSSLIFLFPGALSARKGCDVLLDALARVRPETARAAEFVFLGPAEDGSRLRADVDQLRARRPEVRLVLEDRFVPEAEFQAHFAEADWILMPYLRPEYSSGILARAAAAGTPVLGPSDGLLGRLITRWSLGRTTGIEPGALAHALDAAVREPMAPDPVSRDEFLERSRPELFAAALLGCFD
jgi:glycosyltransferase involved in cell wall biosynthesis